MPYHIRENQQAFALITALIDEHSRPATSRQFALCATIFRMWHPSWKLSLHLMLGLVNRREDITSLEVFIDRHIKTGEFTQESALERLRSYEQFYNKQLLIIISLIAFVLTPILSVFSAYLDVLAISSGVEPNNWFQRSGAVMVAVSIAMEYGLFTHRSDPHNIPAYTPTERYRDLVKTFKPIGLGATVIGTIIWAYGDLILTKLVILGFGEPVQT